MENKNTINLFIKSEEVITFNMLRSLLNLKFAIGRIGCVRCLFNFYRESQLKNKFYHSNFESKKFFKGVVFCVDGHIKHGGFADRMFGILQTYALCKYLKLPFRIYYKYPFNLEKYIIPATFDWRLSENEMSYNKFNSKPLVFLGDYNWIKHFSRSKKIKSKACQIHLYSNVRLLDTINNIYKTNYTFEQLFHELFKPSVELETILSTTKVKLPLKYLSLCFRHRNVFGDFSEANFKECSEKDKIKLVNKCKEKIARLVKQYALPVVVTSDSTYFIKAIQSEKNVYTVLKANRTIHMDYTYSGDFITYCQSFIDFYILSEGEIVFMFLSEFQPATSGFPMLIAWSNGKELRLEKV